MICASCGYMLIPTIKMLHELGEPYANPWRTHRGDWNPLSVRKGKSGSRRLADFLVPLIAPPDEGEEDFYWGHNRQPRPWRMNELASWVEIIKAQDVLTRGAKQEILDSRHGDSEISYSVVTREDILRWFEPDVAAMLFRMEDGSIDPREAVEWLLGKILLARRRPVEYAARVMERTGIAGVTSSPKLYLGTIHSFKGSEADVVFVFPDLSPQAMHEWQRVGKGRDGIIRAFYVALTRARQKVYICMPGGNLSVPLAAATRQRSTYARRCHIAERRDRQGQEGSNTQEGQAKGDSDRWQDQVALGEAAVDTIHQVSRISVYTSWSAGLVGHDSREGDLDGSEAPRGTGQEASAAHDE